jgi:hypothetical protein
MASNQPTTKVYNAFDLADTFLKAGGYNNNKVTRAMLAAWFMAESSRNGAQGINVHNNNPLNITTPNSSDPNFHFIYGKNGTPLKMANGQPFHYKSYATVAEGAAAWANLMNSTKYAGIKTALNAGDPVMFVSAISRSPWGSSGSLVGRIYNGFGNVSNLGTGVSVPGTTGSVSGDTPFGGGTNPSLGEQGAGTPLGAFYKNGVPLVTYPQGTILTDKMVTDIMLQANSMFDSNSSWFLDNFISSEQAKNTFHDLLMKHVGEPWTPLLIMELSGESGVAAVQAGASTPFDKITKTLGDVLAPGEWPQRLFRGGVMIAGVLMMWRGIALMLSSANVAGISAGGGGGSGNSSSVIIETFDDADEGEEAVGEAVEEMASTPRRTRKPKGPAEYEDVVDNSQRNPTSSTFAPRKDGSAASERARPRKGGTYGPGSVNLDSFSGDDD